MYIQEEQEEMVQAAAMALEGQEVVALEGQGEEEEGTGSEGQEEEQEQEQEQKLVVYSSRVPPQRSTQLLVFLLLQLRPAPGTPFTLY